MPEAAMVAAPVMAAEAAQAVRDERLWCRFTNKHCGGGAHFPQLLPKVRGLILRACELYPQALALELLPR